MEELDLLGDLLQQTLKFKDSGFDENLVLRDETTFSDVPAGVLFEKSGKRWHMRTESIPGDLSIKAIAVDDEGFYVETAPLDSSKISRLINEEMMPFNFDAKEGTFRNAHTGNVLAKFSKPVKPEEGLGERSLCTVPLKNATRAEKNNLVRLLDLLYSRLCFILEDEESASAAPVISMRQVQQLQISLQHKLSVEQRPLLSLQDQVRDEQRPELRTELKMMFALERKLLTMTQEELLDFLVDFVTENGPDRAANMLLFTIAGRIKREAAPNLTWKEARRLAQKIVTQQKSA